LSLPEKKLIELYSAKNSKKTIAEKYSYSLPWILFSSRVLKNSFIRKYLKGKQNNICLVCNSELNGTIHLHHIDYEHICQLGETIEFETGKITKTGKKQIRKTTNCEKCFNEKPDFFNSCVDKLVFIHNKCHGMLHNESKRK
jgi:hypothetical protein